MSLAIATRIEDAVPLLGRLVRRIDHHYQRLKPSHPLVERVENSVSGALQLAPVRLLDRVACKAWDAADSVRQRAATLTATVSKVADDHRASVANLFEVAGQPLYRGLDWALGLIEANLDYLFPPPIADSNKPSAEPMASLPRRLLVRVMCFVDHLRRRWASSIRQHKPSLAAKPENGDSPVSTVMVNNAKRKKSNPIKMNGQPAVAAPAPPAANNQHQNRNQQELLAPEDETLQNQLAAVVEHLLAASNGPEQDGKLGEPDASL